ncbi:MAG: hypothetical protein U9Q34_04595, partial [Elusimicrobiota bacterium]|nr:hypothetical protein [Elusimicrobiota bacterium]
EKTLAIECVADFNIRDFIPKLLFIHNASKNKKIKISAAKALVELNNKPEIKDPGEMSSEEFDEFVKNL